MYDNAEIVVTHDLTHLPNSDEAVILKNGSYYGISRRSWRSNQWQRGARIASPAAPAAAGALTIRNWKSAKQVLYDWVRAGYPVSAIAGICEDHGVSVDELQELERRA
jgi:hypothetical protein